MENLKRVNSDIFPHIHINGYSLSIQGSKYHYSSPKKDLNYIKDYTTVEVLISSERKNVEILKEFDWYNKCYFEYTDWSDINSDSELVDYVIAGYVPIDVVDTIIDDIKSLKVGTKVYNTKKALHCEYCGYDNDYFLDSKAECAVFWSDKFNGLWLSFECKKCGTGNGKLII